VQAELPKLIAEARGQNRPTPVVNVVQGGCS
jgi:hypothetical protein